MKKLFTLIFTVGTYLCSAQQAFYDVIPANGNGIRFWQNDAYKIHMGNSSEYQFGPVTDYSIKMSMDNFTNGRGWTWGRSGVTPVAALNVLGNMQIAGTFQSSGNIINSNPTNGWIGLTGDLPGYSVGGYPTLKSNGTYLYFSGGGKYSGYMGGSADAVLGLNDAAVNTKILLNSNGNSYLNGGNVGIGTTSPSSKLTIDGIDNYSDGITIQNTTGYKHLITAFADGVNPTTGSALQFKVANNNAGGNVAVMTLKGSGNVGIGTTSPQSTLDIRGNIVTETGTDPIIYTGVGSSELNRYLSLINSTGVHSASGLKAGGILIADSYAYANPGKNDLIVKGNVGIGTPSPDAKLAVSGQVHAQEVKVSVTVPGPDYVFEKDYKLSSLQEIKNYIEQNKHLPEVPSAKEMEKNGVKLGEMNMLLLKKIEELTLHLLNQEKKFTTQEERIKELESIIKEKQVQPHK